MKLTQKTIQILKHFSTINQSIHIREGEYLRTVAHSKGILAKAKLDQAFEQSFAINDLNRFLGSLSLFNDPELEIFSKYMSIKDDNRELNYVFTDPRMIITPPKIEELPETVAEINVPAKAITDVMKALSVMGLPEIAIVGNGETVSMEAVDSSNPTADSFKISKLGNSENTFKAVFRIENMKLLPIDYKVTLTKNLAYYVGDNIEYWVIIENKRSKF